MSSSVFGSCCCDFQQKNDRSNEKLQKFMWTNILTVRNCFAFYDECKAKSLVDDDVWRVAPSCPHTPLGLSRADEDDDDWNDIDLESTVSEPSEAAEEGKIMHAKGPPNKGNVFRSCYQSAGTGSSATSYRWYMSALHSLTQQLDETFWIPSIRSNVALLSYNAAAALSLLSSFPTAVTTIQQRESFSIFRWKHWIYNVRAATWCEWSIGHFAPLRCWEWNAPRKYFSSSSSVMRVCVVNEKRRKFMINLWCDRRVILSSLALHTNDMSGRGTYGKIYFFLISHRSDPQLKCEYFFPGWTEEGRLKIVDSRRLCGDH